MKYTDMEIGKIYFSNYDNYAWLARYKGVEGTRLQITNYMRKQNSSDDDLGYFSIHNNSWGGVLQFERELREADYREIAWFEACEKAGKFVECPKLEQYEIY